MSYGPISVFTVTMASGGTLTSEVDLARSWKNVYLAIPTMTSNTNHLIQGSDTSGGTFRKVYHPVAAGAAAELASFVIHSSLTNALVPIPNGVRFLKVETTASVAGGTSYKIICSD